MSHIPLGVKLSCNSLFSSYSNTAMHTDDYNSTARRPAARFNQIYLKLREPSGAERRKLREGSEENQRASSSETISTFFFFV